MHFAFCIIIFADVAELADALVSGSSEAIHVGSSPVVRTRVKTKFILGLYFFALRIALYPERRRDRPHPQSSVFALKTVINCFLNKRHRPHQGKG